MNDTLNESDLTRGIAYHEAGHTVLQYLFGFKLVSVFAHPKADAGRASCELSLSMQIGDNAVFFEGTLAQDRYLSHRIMLTQAGGISQQLFCPATYRPENSNRDRRDIEQLASQRDQYASRGEREAVIDELAGYTEEMLAEDRCAAAVHALAAALMKHGNLSGDRAGEIIRVAITGAAKRHNTPGRIVCPHCVAWEDHYDEFEEYERECREACCED